MSILVLYYSRNGSTAALARQVCRGVESITGMTATLRTVPPVAPVISAPEPAVPPSGPPYATYEELAHCSGLILGSPTRFGNMAAPLKYFLDGSSAVWASGALVGKPAAVFSSTSTQHGGHESTLLTMMLPLLHHGMLLMGLPFSEPAVVRTTRGGGPYGAGTIASDAGGGLTEDEKTLAQLLGRRVAEVAARLRAAPAA
jgi:NAD(P)H dehydrogenase (quinone)